MQFKFDFYTDSFKAIVRQEIRTSMTNDDELNICI